MTTKTIWSDHSLHPPYLYMVRRCGISKVAILLIFLSNHLFSQIPVIRFDNYSTKDGLLEGIVLDFTRDQKGFLWVHTESGVSRFDGLHFKTYPLPLQLNPPHKSLFEDKAGHLWITDGLYLYCYNRSVDQFERYEIGITSNAQIIFILDEHPDGQLWFIAGTKLYRIDPFSRKLQVEKKELPKKIFKCCRDKKGWFWMGDGSVLYGYAPVLDSLFHVDLEDFFRTYNAENVGFYAMELWYDLLTYTKFADKKNPKNKIEPSLPDWNTYPGDRMMLWPGVTGDTALWAFQKEYKGIKLLSMRHQYQQLAHYKSSKLNNQSIADDWIQCMYPDPKGILWLGMVKGISMANPDRQRVVRYEVLFGDNSQELVLVNNSSGATFENCILFHDRRQITYWHEGKIRRVKAKGFAPDDSFLKHLPAYACFDQRGDIWMSSNTGIHRINKQKGIIDYSYIIDKTCQSNISNLECDKKNNLHFIWNGQLVIWNVGNRQPHTILRLSGNKDASQKKDDLMMNKTMGGDGNLWVCDKKSTSVFSINTVSGNINRRYDLSAFLSSYASTEGHIIDLNLDNKGYLWITLPFGLAQMDTLTGICSLKPLEDKYRPYRSMGRFSNSAIDAEGNIWSSSASGIYCYKRDQDRFLLFTEKDGASALYNSAVFLHGNYLFFSYPDHTFDRVDPALILQPLPIPEVFIDGFKLANQEKKFDWDSTATFPVQLSYLDNVITFLYTAVDFTAPQQITFQYHLDGFDEDWQEAGARREATYTNLSSGNYTFRVRTINGDGVISSREAIMKIHISPPYWATWWFRTLLIVAFVALVYGIFRYRELQRLRQEQLRLRIARDLHDEMGSTLSSISILSEAALRNLQADIDRTRFGVIGDRARQVMDAMSDIVWSVNPGNDFMENVLQRMKEFAVEILETQGIVLHFEVDEAILSQDLSMEKRKNFYLFFKEAINNAAKYSKATDVWVQVRTENDHFRLEVRDNGCGFDAAQVKLGNGLWNMQQRAERLGGLLSLQSTAGRGTVVAVTVKR